MKGPNTPDDWAKDLDVKERLFVENYLATLNKVEAAKLAGYTHESARRYAHEIFNRPHVREAIEQLLAIRPGVTRQWLVDKLFDIVNLDPSEYLHRWGPDGVIVKESSKIDDGTLKLLTEVIETRNEFGSVVKIKAIDKFAAIHLLAKIMRLDVQRHEVSGPLGGPVQTETVSPRAGFLEQIERLSHRDDPPVVTEPQDVSS